MPEYVYRAMTRSGQEVKNKVDESSRFSLIRKIKRNNLIPISVTQVNITKIKGKKKNARNKDETLNALRNAGVKTASNNAMKKPTLKERVSLVVNMGEKITVRDVMIFTQNFYLLKKANFNNIHALSTIIESTENASFRAVLEDILAGLENGEYMYSTMEYYSSIFPYIYVNMVKVGELSGSLTESMQQAIKYLDESTAMTKKVKKVLVPNIVQSARNIYNVNYWYFGWNTYDSRSI